MTQKFKNAEANGIEVQEKSVDVDEIISHLKNHGPIILLTNAANLSCEFCKKSYLTSKLLEGFTKTTNYHGHYVVLCGYNLKNERLYYRNPANSDSKFLLIN